MSSEAGNMLSCYFVACLLSCEQKFLSGIAFSIYELICVAASLFTPPRENKPTTRLTSHRKDFVNAKSHARKKPLLAESQTVQSSKNYSLSRIPHNALYFLPSKSLSCPELNLVFVPESKGLYYLRDMKFGAREKALLSCLKSPFPSLSNAYHVG